MNVVSAGMHFILLTAGCLALSWTNSSGWHGSASAIGSVDACQGRGMSEMEICWLLQPLCSWYAPPNGVVCSIRLGCITCVTRLLMISTAPAYNCSCYSNRLCHAFCCKLPADTDAAQQQQREQQQQQQQQLQQLVEPELDASKRRQLEDELRDPKNFLE
jgi:hypothetical protein